jgi:putative addiction module component (TIGR02574 family)
MTSTTLDQVRNEALALPEAERAALARDLVASLDGQLDTQAASDWDVEIKRRLDQVDQGAATTIDRNELTRRMRESTGRN